MPKLLFEKKFAVKKENYDSAGTISTFMKKQLKKMKADVQTIRHVAVASYEVELNLVIHSLGGEITYSVYPDEVKLVSQDYGPGIDDISSAMSAGWSTATEEAQSLGFGAGMGLPNMKRNSDTFDIQSTPGVGTRIEMHFKFLKELE